MRGATRNVRQGSRMGKGAPDESYFFATLTDRRLRPRARRRLITWRPARVRMRLRKPWVRLRRFVCG